MITQLGRNIFEGHKWQNIYKATGRSLNEIEHFYTLVGEQSFEKRECFQAASRNRFDLL